MINLLIFLKNRWQDVLITLGQLTFMLALVPTIRHKDKPHKKTSFINSIVMLLFTFTNFTLSLILASLTSFILAIMWLFIGYQKHLQDKEL